MTKKISIEITKKYLDFSDFFMGYDVVIKSGGVAINTKAYAFEKKKDIFSIYCDEELPILNESVIDIDLRENDVDFKVIYIKGICKRIVKDYTK